MGDWGVWPKQAVLISGSLLVNEVFIQTDIVPVRTLSSALSAYRQCTIFQHDETLKLRRSAIRLVILVTSWFCRKTEPAAVFYNNAFSRVQEYINSKTVNVKMNTAITKRGCWEILNAPRKETIYSDQTRDLFNILPKKLNTILRPLL